MFFKLQSWMQIVPTFYMPAFLYMIYSSYDPMNFAVTNDPYYETDFPLLAAATGFDISTNILTHRQLLKKYWKL
jgi:hypothetical protein